MKVKNIKICVSFIIVTTIVFEVISFASSKQYNNEDGKNEQMIQTLGVDKEESLSREERDTLDLINEYRNQNGLKSLKAFSNLQQVAKLKAEDLVNNNYFSHTSEKLGTPFKMLEQNGIEYRIAGENLAGNTTPERAVQAWINSDSHRANILEEKFEYTGIYIVNSEVYGKVYVQIFVGI